MITPNIGEDIEKVDLPYVAGESVNGKASYSGKYFSSFLKDTRENSALGNIE